MKFMTLLIMGLCFTTCVEAQQKTKTASKKQLETWINQLSDGSFRERRKASNNLRKAGRLALPHLAKGAQSEDAELSNRSFDLIIKMFEGKDKALVSIAEKTLGDLGNSSNKKVAERATKELRKSAINAVKRLAGFITFDKSGKVESIDFTNSKKITDHDLMHLRVMTSLTGLGLNNTKVTDAGLRHLQGLPALKFLDVRSTRISDFGLGHLKSNLKLEGLYLANTKVTDDGLKHLKRLTKLKKLDLSKTKLTDSGLKHLKMLKSLESLKIQHTKVTYPGVNELKSALSKCGVIW